MGIVWRLQLKCSLNREMFNWNEVTFECDTPNFVVMHSLLLLKHTRKGYEE